MKAPPNPRFLKSEPNNLNKNMHQYIIYGTLGLRMKFKNLFMSNEEKHGHHFDLPLFFNISMLMQFLAP